VVHDPGLTTNMVITTDRRAHHLTLVSTEAIAVAVSCPGPIRPTGSWPCAPPPVLGPPLPGDLGRPILEHRRHAGLEPDPADRAAEAERQRLATQAFQALQARESGVLFRIDTRPVGAMDAGPDADGSDRTGADTPTLALPADRLALDPERDPNGQQTKLDFLNRRQTGGIYNPHSLETTASPHQVMAGSIIAASLITGLNSDLPRHRDRPGHRERLRHRHGPGAADPAGLAPDRHL